MNTDTLNDMTLGGKVSCQSPSNIAIVKYWGKSGIQLPLNPSISFTLKNAITSTSITYQYQKNQNDLSFDLLFENKTAPSFELKLSTFLKRTLDVFPWLTDYYLHIESTNTFPHSSGIASSASSYSALAILLAEIHQKITGETLGKNQVSNIARLGSGSACRSVYGGWNTWGESAILKNSSQEYAINLNKEIHPIYQTIQDTILIVSRDIKKTSSTAGHQLMDSHPYKTGRIKQAFDHTQQLYDALKTGDIKTFIEISEAEALSLHALMMSSTPGFTLLSPNSLHIIKEIRNFRENHHIPICFTIDAGPNIHILYPQENKKTVHEFIESKLMKYCVQKIDDEIGSGPCLL
jgi:diphosphomevalonate decarboxylase